MTNRHDLAPRLRRTLAACAVALGGACAVTAYAQDQATAPDQTADQSQQLTTVTITGSHLRQTDQGTLPVTTITADQINETGAVNSEQILQSVTSALQGNSNTVEGTGSGATTGGISTVSLRGLGSQRTLVLINGRRVAGGGTITDSVSVDVNSIPTELIQRIDVDKEGASAVYGSDAIAGVVNFVLRDSFQGVQVSGYGGGTTDGGGAIRRFDAIAGFGNLLQDRYNVMIAGSFQKEDPLFGADRSFSASGINVAAGNDVTSGNAFPANVASLGTAADGNAFGTSNPMAGNCAPSVSDPLIDPTGSCRYDPSPFVSLLPAAQRYNVYSAAHFALTDDIQLYAEASYYQSREKFVIQPTPLSDEFSIPSNNPLYNIAPYDGYATFNLAPSSPYYPTSWVQSKIAPGAPLPVLDVFYRSYITGDRALTDSSGQPRAVFGIKGTAAGWDFDGGFLWSQTQLTEYDNDGYPAYSKILPLLNSGLVNPFGPTNDPTVAAEAQAANYYGPAYATKTSLGEFDGHASRDVVQLPAGELETAIDVTFRKEKFETDPSATIQSGDIAGYGGNFLPVNVQRNVFGAGLELQVPIVGSLAANPAVRFDHYEGTGSKWTPKIGLRWKPLDQLLLRGSYTKGFRAPSLSELYAPDTQTVTENGLSDPARCPTTGSAFDCNTQFNSVSGGNANLKPETSDTYTAGFILEPVHDLSLGVDYFQIKLQNTIIFGVDPAAVLADPQLFGDLITRAAPDASCPGCPGRIVSIAQTNTNFGETDVKGLDVDFQYHAPATPIGTFGFDLQGTYFATYREEQPDGTFLSVVGMVSPITNGNGGVIPRWHQYAILTWDRGPWEAVLDNNYQSSYLDLPSTVSGNTREVASYSVFDLQASWSGIRNLKLAVGARNIFDKNPPYTNAGGQNYFQAGYDPGYVDPRGRFIYGTVTYSIGGG